MDFNDSGSKYLQWAKSYAKNGLNRNGNSSGDEGHPDVQQPPRARCPTGNYDPFWLENTSPNDDVNQQQCGSYRGGNQKNQNHFGRCDNRHHDYEGRHLSGRTYRNSSFANRGGRRQDTYNNNHNAQSWEKPKGNYVPPSRRYLDQRRSKDARVTLFSKRPSNRDVQSHSSSGEQSDDNETQDYMNDLIQYVQRRYDLPNNSHHQPKPSRRSSHEWDNKNRRSSFERDSRSRCSSSERVDRGTKKSNKPSGWDIKKSNTSSKSEMASNPHSDSENELYVANKFPSSRIRQTKTNRSTSTSNVPESTNFSSIKPHQSNIDKSIVAQSSEMTIQSTKISSASIIHPTKVKSTKVSATITSTSTSEVPSSDTQQSNINLSMPISNVPESALLANAIKSNVDNSIVAQSNDLLATTNTTQSASSIPESSNNLPPSANIESMELSKTLTSTEKKPNNNASPLSVINQSVDLSEELKSTESKLTDASLSSLTPVLIDLTETAGDIEYPDKGASSPTVDLSAKLNTNETKPSDVSHSIPAPELIDLSNFDENDCCTASILEKSNKHPATNKPLISQEHASPITNAPMATHNFEVPVKPSHTMNRKRSLESSNSTESNDQNSSAAVSNTSQPDADEVPAKKSTCRTSIPAATTEVNKQSEKSAAIIEEKNNNVIVKSIVPRNSSSNENQSDSFDKIVAATTTSKNVPMKRVNCENNEIVCEKNESKPNLHRKEINKKPKIDKKESKVDKPIILKKNHIEQFKFILKIMKTRSSSWSLSHSTDINVNNFCDAIHHFEKQSDKICALTEVKFFDDTAKFNKINYKNLFGDEFNIQRYFGTFYKIERSCFSNQHSKFVIMTNREIDIALFRNNGIKVSCENDCYTLKVKQPYDESKIYKKCLECFVLPKLAELLCEFVRSDRKIPHFNMELMRKYHLALVKENVLQIVDDIKTREKVAKFHPYFIEGIDLSNAAKELRYHLEKCLHGLPTETMKFRVGNKDFGEDVASMRYGGTVDKLPDENCKATFEHFFKVFKIVKITKLSDEMIKRELGEKFLKLEEPAYFKTVQEELLIFLKDYGLKSDILESLQHTISKLEVTEKILQRPCHNIDVQFEQETFANLSEAIKTENVILCSTESLLLSELKMRQFSKNLRFSDNQESLFVTDKILFEITEDVVSALLHISTNLLVIVWEENVVIDCRRTKQIEEVIEKLRDVTNKSQGKKKSIIIADKCNVNLSLPRYEIFRIDEDLTFKSQNDRFKSTKVSLQERAIQLSDLADNAAIERLIKNPKILEKFLIEEIKIGCALSKPSGFKEKLYNFKLKQHVIINPKIFQENINDVFLISKIDYENFYLEYKPSDQIVHLSDSQSKTANLPLNARYFILDSNVNPAFIRNKIKGKNVHHFSYESNNFIWKSTSGSSATLLNYKITNVDEDCVSFTINDILMNGPKTIIVSGESGIGKSVCLYDFANRINEVYQSVWIIQVDMNKPLKHALKGYPIETSENAIHFLADYLDLKDEQKELFIMSAQGQLKIKLMLFVDGYDDVYENVNMMTKLLHHMQNSKVERMFITSRTDKLENILGIFSYSLQFVSEEKFQFADKICDGKDFKYNLAGKSKLLNTPLHLKMYMELCQKKPEKLCIDNLYDLYKSYVNLHLPSNQLENAYKLSAQKFLTEKELEEIGVTIENLDLEFPEELSRKTVIEYFTAKWLSKRHLNTKKYIDNLIERTSSVFLNVYLAAYKAEKKNKISINEYAEYGFLRSLKAILELDNTSKPCLCRLIRKGKNKTKEILQFLLEYYNDTGCRGFIEHTKYVDSNLVKYVNQLVKGQTPLQIAAEKNQVDLACELMLNGADISLTSSSFITSMATYATKELANGNIRLGPIAVILLEKQDDKIQTTVHLDVETQFPIVLAYLFSHGHEKLIKQLLGDRDPRDRCKLLETKINGKSLLDQINESEIIDDDKRWQLIEYLRDNLNDPNFLQSNIDSILRSTCNYGHEITFNYYITYSKSSIDVLHEALLSNDEKIINFLMRDTKRTRDSNGNNALHQAIILGVSRKTMNYLLGKVGINDINNAGETVLHLAFKEGANLSTIKFLVDAGASLNVSNELGFYPWFVAIKEESSRYSKEQQRELMMYLQTKNVRFPEGKIPNHEFDLARKEILPKLVYYKNSDDYNVDYDENKNSRLHLDLPSSLSCQGKKNWCIFLINHGADVNIVKNGKSAFNLALECGCYDVAKLMLQHGAIINKADKTGKTTLDCLNRSKNSDCQTMKGILSLAHKIFENDGDVLEIIQLVDSSTFDNSYFRYLLNCRDKNWRTLLHVAACTNDASIINCLYKFFKECEFRYKDFVPMDVNAIDNHGNTPLHLAAKKNNECVAKLLSIGARFQMPNLDGKKPMDLSMSGSSVRKWLQAADDLFKLIQLKKIEEVRKLLKTYPEVSNSRDKSGKTPLHLARDENLMKLLLANKYVDVNALDDEHKPPIYYAVNENYLDGVKLLLKAGANYEFKGIQNGTNKSFKLLQRIDELFDDIHSHEPRFFVKSNHWPFEKQLDDIVNTFGITRDIVVNVRDSQRNFLLHYAAKYDYVDVTENLLKNGAIYNSRNKLRKTPIELAINSKRLLKSVDDLFNNLDVNTWTNVDPIIAVNCRMSGGFTLLHKAMLTDNSETFKWLLERGADINATMNNSVGIRFVNQTNIAKLLKR